MSCLHKYKKVVDSPNMDGEVYYECPDCGEGWRALPDNEEDLEAAEAIEDIDLKALGIKREDL